MLWLFVEPTGVYLLDFFCSGMQFYLLLIPYLCFISLLYEGGSICNENPFITPSKNALGFYAICQTKDQSVAVIMLHETLFHLNKFDKLQTF